MPDSTVIGRKKTKTLLNASWNRFEKIVSNPTVSKIALSAPRVETVVLVLRHSVEKVGTLQHLDDPVNRGLRYGEEGRASPSVGEPVAVRPAVRANGDDVQSAGANRSSPTPAPEGGRHVKAPRARCSRNAGDDALIIKNDLGPNPAGPIRMTGNLLAGSNYVVYIVGSKYPLTGVTFSDNRVSPVGSQYGACDTNVPFADSGNVNDADGSRLLHC